MLIGSTSASAYTDEQRKWCYAPEATDEQTIDGCTALAQSGQFSGRDLAIILYDRGLSYENTKQYNLAMADFSQAVGLDPTYADAFDDRGNVYTKTGDYNHAIADYDRAISLKSDVALYYSNRGYTYYLKGDNDAALTDLDRAISLDQKTGRIYVNRALARFAKHDCQGTVDDLLAAKRLNWNYTVSDAMKAQCGSAMAQMVGK
ncbi:MAG TPA: tetratricopeptide repeat protein [Rhizomicrobium sp.]|nr:tetratricopeptide repeat protein [Rhizomicrobium sp.]